MLFVSICGLLSEAEEEQWIWGRWIKKLSGQVTRPLGKHVSQGEDSMCHPKPRAGSLSFLPRLYQMFFLLGVGALKTYNLARYGIIVFNLLLHCQMSQTSSPPSLPFRWPVIYLSLTHSLKWESLLLIHHREITGPEQMRWSAQQQCWDMDLQSTADREGEDDIVLMCRKFQR